MPKDFGLDKLIFSDHANFVRFLKSISQANIFLHQVKKFLLFAYVSVGFWLF